MITQRFPFDISFSSGSRSKTAELRAGEHFRFDLEAVNTFCLEDLPARLVDLLRIGSSIYVVDRLVKRRQKEGMKKPSRIIGVKLGVLDAKFWNSTEVRAAIQESVDFVSGDFWNFEFVADNSEFSRAGRLLCNPYEGLSPLVCLYSGGLDSAAGLAVRMVENPGRPVLPITVWHQPRQPSLIREQLELLRGRFNTPVDSMIVKVAIKWTSKLDRAQEELSQRCRSFLFASLGAIAAIMHRQSVVEMFESGIGAINLPLMAGMVGAKTTKSAHPKFLRLMSRLASLVAQNDVEFYLPFLSKTKGEVVRSLRDNGLDQLANLSASCVHYPQRHCRHKQCGVCPACIFRRQAMVSAGIDETEDVYEYDFLGSPQAANDIPAKRLQFLKAFLMQVAWLKDADTRMQLPPAFARHLISTEILGREQSQEDAIELLARYRDEWMDIASIRREKGHNWARLLATHELKMEGVTHASA
ncbi:MAG: 7-cyano-7-deazaguanine synthase [Gemmataceae bacterium]|nr:7-cyano-7-deazaguanine synthase [Gemmataceae bacterium]